MYLCSHVFARLIKESREREARASEMQAMEHAAGSSHSSWIDLGDMIDIDRADAFGTQWQPQPRWYRSEFGVNMTVTPLI